MGACERQRAIDVKKLVRSIALSYCGHESHEMYDEDHPASDCPGRHLGAAIVALSRFVSEDFRREKREVEG